MNSLLQIELYDEGMYKCVLLPQVPNENYLIRYFKSNNQVCGGAAGSGSEVNDTTVVFSEKVEECVPVSD